MTWTVLVRHSTGYRYAAPVRASYNEARMTPQSDERQQVMEARLEVEPDVTPLRYRDYWGCVVDAFDVHVPHTELSVTATSVVETSAPAQVAPPVGWDVLAATSTLDRFAELLAPSRFVVVEPEVEAAATGLRAAHLPGAAGRQAAQWAQDQLTYQRGSTGVHTTSAQARVEGKGVCQDFAHLTLSLLRSMGLPARYVSGYLHPDRDAEVGETARGESHAWVEFWAGSWVAVDPTGLADVGQQHVTVARGRDYADVRPLSGVYHGPRSESFAVSVDITRVR